MIAREPVFEVPPRDVNLRETQSRADNDDDDKRNGNEEKSALGFPKKWNMTNHGHRNNVA